MLLTEVEMLNFKARPHRKTSSAKTWFFQGANHTDGPICGGGKEEGRMPTAFDCCLICLYLIR